MIWGIVAIAALAVFGVIVWRLSSRRDPSIELVQQQLSALSERLSGALGSVTTATGAELGRLHQRVDERLKETSEIVQSTHRSVGERLDQNSRVFAQVSERLGRLEEAQKQIQIVGEEIASLHNILRAPKLRGNLGELFLEELLSQILPRTYYEMQYSFKSGDRVDAVIRLPQNLLVPVDAKFPLENFQRMSDADAGSPEREQYRKAFGQDFKKHVDQIADKYILPDEGTLDFALMYVPAENIYYESILRDPQFGEDKGINTYALSRRVIPVSPNSLYAYLQAIVLGLRGLKIESQAKEILSFLGRLRSDLLRLGEEYELTGKHLQNAVAAHGRGEKKLEKIQSRMEEHGATSENLPSPPKLINVQN